MTTTAALVSFVSVVVAGLLSGYFLLRTKKTEGQGSRLSQVEVRMDNLERRNRLLSDYVETLRRDLAEHGEVPPWPKELTEMDAA